MSTDLEDWDHAHGLLLSAMLPLVLAPPGPNPAISPRLRGVVRADERRSRVVISHDPAMVSGVAVEVSLPGLYQDWTLHDVDAVLAHVRALLAGRAGAASPEATLPTDCHGNTVVPLPEVSIVGARAAVAPGQELLRLFQLMQRGPIRPSVDDVYTFTGFMLIGEDRCRIYVRVLDTGVSYGLDIPLIDGNGNTILGLSAAFGQELAMKLGADAVLYEPVVDRADDYCSLVYGLHSWIEPPQG
ncbi:hypothetical protein [Micromonospora sp. NPDC049799]|uniref:hypothetical protein n=1 Tax=Micromonospora sp. NPDC049799 TaxID=3154741 RepID=UPI0033DCA43D